MPEMKLNYAKGFIGGQVQQNYDPDQPRDPKGSSTGGQWTSGGENQGTASNKLKRDERYTRETNAIKSSPYLEILDDGTFTGYHWTPENLDGKKMKGMPFDENLGFTMPSADLKKDGAVFAFTDDGLKHGGDWFNPTGLITEQYPKLYKITGEGYLVKHSQEGMQIIFRADKIDKQRIFYKTREFDEANKN